VGGRKSALRASISPVLRLRLRTSVLAARWQRRVVVIAKLTLPTSCCQELIFSELIGYMIMALLNCKAFMVSGSYRMYACESALLGF